MGYQQGLSGLSASASDLDVIGNNIANANTVGFKQGNAQFADMYANSLATAVNNQIGIGTMQSEVQQDFSQGSINSTCQALNVAINGNGFYQMSNNGATTYSRNGVFHLTSDGNVVNAQGLKLMGYAADPSGVVNTASTVPLTIPTTNISPKATTSVAAQLNLDSQATPPSDPTFSPTDSNTYNFSTSVQTYDSLGGTEQLNMYFVKSPTAGTWNVYAGPNGGATSNLGTMTFNSAGTLTNPANGQFAFSMPTADGSTTPEPITLNFSGTTQYGGASGINNLKPDGYAAGQLSNFSIGQDGTITGNYSNGQTTALGQIVLANFNNPNGLLNLGGNEFQQTAASGTAQVSAPGATNHGTLTGGAVEESNVDLTNQLVNLITAQRNYQANAQTIKTQQTVDQTLINL